MFNPEYLLNLLTLASLFALIALSFVLIFKINQIKRLQTTIDKLKKNLQELDEQAKLIVRTDMELNKAQEELDKKITSLYGLQRLTRLISTTLQENQIFACIEDTTLEELGFDKALGFLWNSQKNKFLPRLNIGYLAGELKAIQANIDLNQGLYLDLIQKEKTLSSISILDSALKDRINAIFKTTSFVISSILPKEGGKGFLFAGTEGADTLITEGDEESITILANQLGQALENARLFEKTWAAQQGLEKKVEERTRELTLALEEVKKISKRKTDFVSSVSHELRTPLTSIKGYASILLAGKLGKLPKEIEERLEKINRHSDELVQLVNGLLDISRIESGRVMMKQEPHNLKDIVDKALDLLSVQIKEKQLVLNVNIAEGAMLVFVDAGQIQRVFINIIGNAIKFTPAKGKISILSHKVDKEVQVDVVDTGCGIPQETQEAIFEEFYRVDNPINEQLKGTGLGLALVRYIIEAHSGKIWVKSKIGEGSTFSFTLPQPT